MDISKIPFFNYQELFKQHEQGLTETLLNTISKGAYILQNELEEFEQNLKLFLGVKYAFGVADGTNALILSLKAAGIEPGDEVILPSHTYVATAASVHLIGAVPVLVECGQDHMIDVLDISRAITKKTKAIMPVQLNGRTCDMDAIKVIAEDNNLLIIEDSAQALGSKYKGQSAGTFGKAGTFSFYPAKLLGCFGDGGAVVTNDDEMGEKLFLLRDHGRNKDGEVVTWGTNSRLDNIQAAVLNYKLKFFEQDINRRRQVARRYHDELSAIDALTLPPGPDADEFHFDVYQNYELQAQDRDALSEHLREKEIHTIIQWGGKAVHQLKGLGFDNVSLPKTEEFFKHCLMLPMNTFIRDEEVGFVIDSIKRFYGSQ